MGEQPITELQISTLHSRYFAPVESFMRLHQCTVSYQLNGIYLFLFPPGTQEIEHQNHPQGEKWSTIKLPDGLKLTMKVILPQEEGGPSYVLLIFPDEAYGVDKGMVSRGRRNQKSLYSSS